MARTSSTGARVVKISVATIPAGSWADDAPVVALCGVLAVRRGVMGILLDVPDTFAITLKWTTTI
jgi:hypothetical protein